MRAEIDEINKCLVEQLAHVYSEPFQQMCYTRSSLSREIFRLDRSPAQFYWIISRIDVDLPLKLPSRSWCINTPPLLS